MNNQLLEKVIKSNNLPCPEFIFENPILDKNVARSLSKSFVKILNLSQPNSKVNNNLRLSILENIRKLCKIEPESHINLDNNITMLLSEIYTEKLKDTNIEDFDSTNKDLDEFLIRNMKDMNINSSYKPTINPEVLQALINLNESRNCLDTLLNDIIHWNCTDTKNVHIVKELWESENSEFAEDLSVKIKSEIERILLEICYSILSDTVSSIEELFISNTSLKNIVKRSSDSANCFQICCSVLNYLFIMTNFDMKIQTFVQTFIKNVKQSCIHITFSVLYQRDLSHIVILLDIDIDELPSSLQKTYIEAAIKYLSKLQSKSENDLIMLLTHFPKWINIYFTHQELISSN